jgi:hypothetical protein
MLELTKSSGENTPNCTFLMRRSLHLLCVKFKLGLALAMVSVSGENEYVLYNMTDNATFPNDEMLVCLSL